MSPDFDTLAAERFATDIVQQLRTAGHEAYWAGGCVRDRLLGIQPKDFDVATGATPDQIRELFGHRRTKAVGASFGVINVIGPKSAGHIEVATFRRDLEYRDGRHPEGIRFATAKEDAQRRDFTINGLFFDPETESVIDFVGGQEDLAKHVIRAIGRPDDRIAEDKLRMLRAVRFAARFDFKICDQTLEAIRRNASQIAQVSQERITDEIERMLVHANRAGALHWLEQSELIRHLPEAPLRHETQSSSYSMACRLIERIEPIGFANVMTAWLWPFSPPKVEAGSFLRKWKVANDVRDQVLWTLSHLPTLRCAHEQPWPRVQRLLIQQEAIDALDFIEALDRVEQQDAKGVRFCRERLTLPSTELNPAALIDGGDLIAMGIEPGPMFKSLLDQVRDLQLEGQLDEKQGAIEYVKTRLAP